MRHFKVVKSDPSYWKGCFPAFGILILLGTLKGVHFISFDWSRFFLFLKRIFLFLECIFLFLERIFIFRMYFSIFRMYFYF